VFLNRWAPPTFDGTSIVSLYNNNVDLAHNGFQKNQMILILSQGESKKAKSPAYDGPQNLFRLKLSASKLHILLTTNQTWF
jgi:hypothetical protein